MAILYSNIAGPQRNGLNLPDAGASLVAAPTGAGFNDPVFELGTLSEITAVYTMTGAEVQSDIIYIARLGMGAIVDPVHSNVASTNVAATATLSVGDTDTVGGTQAADTERYSTPLNVASNMSATTALAFAGGTALVTPQEITDDNPGDGGQQVWLTAKFVTLATPVAGKKLVFRIKLADNR